jgi:DNA-binding GntR family transcriptional regulator
MRAAGNDLLLKMWESLHVEIHSRKTLLQPNVDMRAVAESHAPILGAIVAGDVERACRLSREHQAYFELKA